MWLLTGYVGNIVYVPLLAKQRIHYINQLFLPSFINIVGPVLFEICSNLAEMLLYSNCDKSTVTLYLRAFFSEC